MDQNEYPQLESPLPKKMPEDGFGNGVGQLPDDMFGDIDPTTPQQDIPPMPSAPAQVQPPATDSVQMPAVPDIMPSTESAASPDSEMAMGGTSKKPRDMKRIVIVIAVVLSVVAIAVAAWILIQMFGNSTNTQGTQVEQQVEPIEVPTIGIDTATNEPKDERVVLDTDGDGLTDTVEKEIGTSPIKIDTDNDGLTDREEYSIYKTKPTISDTDGDGFLDGEEVKNFFNPNGSGTLVDQLEAFNEKSSGQNE